MSDKKLIIIDGHALLYRAFFALPPLTNSRGQQTNAVYGFLLTFFKAVKDLQANYVVACFDTKKPTFRHEQFVDYKAHRPETPQGIITQIPMVQKVLEAFEIPIFSKDGYEADDLIATITKQVSAMGNCETFIVTGDLDSLQLVDEKTKVYTLGKGVKDTIIYDEERVMSRFGVRPDQMNDFKALVGDVSDNIPGVPGVGKTTAASVVQKYNSIENLYQELATDTAVLKPKVKELLKQHKESALMSLSLAKADRNVPMEFDFEACRFGNFNQEKVKQVFVELGFNSLIDRISGLTHA